MEFKSVKPIDKATAESMLRSKEDQLICEALLSLSFYERDWRFVQNICLKFLDSENTKIVGLAATCLGHIARINHTIDKDVVVTALNKHLSNANISGVIEDALDDISTYT